MPKDPRGEERPTDAIGLAVMIGKIATGEIWGRAQSDQVGGGRAGKPWRKNAPNL
jgi:hypothetical protein